MRTYNKAKIITVFLISTSFIFVCGIIYYNYIQQPFNDMKKTAIQLVKKESEMKIVDRTVYAAYEKKHIIVFGRDESNDKIIAWVTGKHVYWDYETNGISLNQIQNIVRGLYPNVKFQHIVPNVWRDEYVWEVLYKENDTANTRSYYRFYRFSDGKLLAYYALHK